MKSILDKYGKCSSISYIFYGKISGGAIMKFLKTVLLLLLGNTLLASCTIQMKPITMNTQIGSVGIAEFNKIPLSVGVVVTDPATHRIIYKPLRGEAVDQTGQMGDQLWPLNTELAKASNDVFSQIFKSVTSLRQTPALGSNYDLIIIARLKVVQITMKQPKPFQKIPFEMDYLWSLTVMNDEGVEILKREDRTAPKILTQGLSTDAWFATIGTISSELMSEMVTSWGRMIYDAREIRSYLEGDSLVFK